MKSCRLPVAAACFLTVLFAAGWVASAVQAAEKNQTHPDVPKIRVGVKRLEPFVFINEDGQLSGFSVDLWEAIAADLGMQYEWVTAGTVNEMIASVQSGQTDVAIGGISLSPLRESMVDFTYPYFESGLMIMVRSDLRSRQCQPEGYSLFIRLIKDAGPGNGRAVLDGQRDLADGSTQQS